MGHGFTTSLPGVIPLICDVCGRRFVADSRRWKLCSICRRDRSHHTERSPTEFIGVDGEGVSRPDGRHEYVLLSVGNRSLYHEDGSELTWYDIIPFIWECFLEKPDAAYVGFYLGYDFTHWLKHLPEERARILLTNEGVELRRRTKSGGNHVPFPVEHRGWNFDFLGLKRFRLWEEGSPFRLYICDTGAYFQTSFLNAIDPVKWPDGAILTDVEFAKIKKGKEERGGDIVPYGTPIDPEMIEYNILENSVLSRLMRKYAEGLEDVGIFLKKDQWFGPGQAAQSWMNNIRAPRRDSFEEATNVQIRDALRSSYYGGWFEIFAHGHVPGISWGYDINSAYPDIQSNLPCSIHGTWTEGRGNQYPDGRYVLIYGTVAGTNDFIGAAPHRMRTGNILRPQLTKGWYWLHEINAARAAGLVDYIDVENWWKYDPCDCPPPFAAERKLYQERLKVGKNTIAGKARKLVYNSAYGKTAQSIGVAKYANPFYASLITSLCRTYILRAIATHKFPPSDVLMVATDGIVFRNRHTQLALSEEVLGAWSESQHENLTLFMPGVYWDDSTRNRLAEGKHPSLKSRGIPARALAEKIDEIDSLFSDCFSGLGFPVFELPIHFSLTSPKQALARGKWHTCGTVTTDGNRSINSDPWLKRLPNVVLEGGIIRSYCYLQGLYGVHTTPYNRTFGDEELREIDMLRISPDGDADMLIALALKGE